MGESTIRHAVVSDPDTIPVTSSFYALPLQLLADRVEDQSLLAGLVTVTKGVWMNEGCLGCISWDNGDCLIVSDLSIDFLLQINDLAVKIIIF